MCRFFHYNVVIICNTQDGKIEIPLDEIECSSKGQMVEVRDTESSRCTEEKNEEIITKEDVTKILEKWNTNYDTSNPSEMPLTTYPLKNPLITVYLVGKETLRKMYYGRF